MTSFYYRFHLQKLRAQPYLQAGSKLVAKALLRKRQTMITRHTSVTCHLLQQWHAVVELEPPSAHILDLRRKGGGGGG